jgi:DNA-directed RNA polymerase specialized sigma24 family protein
VENSDDAFAALVARHINLVYSVALRRSGNPDHAEEIT